MKFEVTTMLPVHNIAVKRRLLKLLSSTCLVMAVGFQLNDVVAFTATTSYYIVGQITDLREYEE